MARNSSGTYSSPSADFTTGTTILSTVMNTKLTDLGNEITNSLDRGGKGGMLAALRGVDGSAASPAYSWTNSPGTGFWLPADGQVRIVAAAATLQEWTTTLVTIAKALTCSAGVTVTNATSNGAGVTTTGNGTGAGLVATGGATGNGVTATGGATSGAGVAATGTGNSAGVTAQGAGTGAGVSATGGSTGRGGTFAAGGGNASGVVATGSGTGDGVAGTGGSSNGAGVAGTGGGTTGPGVYGLGASGGPGVTAKAGTAATATTPSTALYLDNGYIDLSAVANPNSDVGFTDKVTPKNVTKAWLTADTDGAGNVTLIDGFNITSVALGGGGIQVTFADDFANDDWCGTVSADSIGEWYIPVRAAGSATIVGYIYYWTGATVATQALNLATSVVRVYAHFIGSQ